MVDGQDGPNLVAALKIVDQEIRNMLGLATILNQLMVVHHVQDQAQKQKNAIHTIVQYMVDGHLGAKMVAVPNHVELEARSTSDLAQNLNQPMVVTNVQVQHPKQRTALLSIAQ